MTTLEKIRADVQHLTKTYPFVDHKDTYVKEKDVIDIIEKYAEQEPTTRQSCDNCKQDRKECGNDDHYGFCQNWEYAEQEPCDDAISRQAVLDGIEELKQSPWATDKRNGFEYLITEALDIVADLCVKQEPPVRPQEQTKKESK